MACLTYSSKNIKKLVKLQNLPLKIHHTKNEHYPYRPGAHLDKGNSSVSTVHVQPVPDRLGQMGRHAAVKKKDREKLEKGGREHFQLPAKL